MRRRHRRVSCDAQGRKDPDVPPRSLATETDGLRRGHDRIWRIANDMAADGLARAMRHAIVRRSVAGLAKLIGQSGLALSTI